MDEWHWIRLQFVRRHVRREREHHIAIGADDAAIRHARRHGRRDARAVSTARRQWHWRDHDSRHGHRRSGTHVERKCSVSNVPDARWSSHRRSDFHIERHLHAHHRDGEHYRRSAGARRRGRGGIGNWCRSSRASAAGVRRFLCESTGYERLQRGNDNDWIHGNRWRSWDKRGYRRRHDELRHVCFVPGWLGWCGKRRSIPPSWSKSCDCSIRLHCYVGHDNRKYGWRSRYRRMGAECNDRFCRRRRRIDDGAGLRDGQRIRRQ